MLEKTKQSGLELKLMCLTNSTISSSYRGQMGQPGDIVYLDDEGFQIVNIEKLNYFVNSREFSLETVEDSLNLIAYLNNSNKIVKVFNENYWFVPRGKQSVRIIFTGFPNTDGITYVIENS